MKINIMKVESQTLSLWFILINRATTNTTFPLCSSHTYKEMSPVT